jgi:hypothetical protein
MKRILFCVALAAPLSAGFGALPPEIEDALVPTRPLVLTASNIEEVWLLRPARGVKAPDYVVVDLPAERLSTEMIQAVRRYVEDGGGLVVTAHAGGQALLAGVASIQTTVPREQDYLLSAVAGDPQHPVLQGVSKAMIEKCDRDRDGIRPWENSLLVQGEGDKGVGLLGGFNLRDKNTAAFGAMVYALGKGRAVLFAQRMDKLPLLQNPKALRVYDNHRLAANLDQWLSGHEVPRSTAPAPGAPDAPRP